MGFLGDLFGGGSQSSTVSGTSLPAWYADYMTNVATAGTDRFLNAGYPGALPAEQRVAPNNADITGAGSLIRQSLGQYAPTLNTGVSAASGVTSGFNPTQFNQYMSPYISQVSDRIARLGERNLTENILPNVNANFIGSGNFGSGQNQDFMNRVIRDTNESIMGQQGQLLNQGFNQQMQSYLTGQGQTLSAASLLGQLGQTGQGMSQRDAAALQQVGLQEQQRQQAALDINNANFLEGRDWGRNMATGAAGLMSGYTPPYSTSSTTTQSGSGGLGQILGGAASLAAVLPGLWGKRRGGRVPGYGYGGGVLRRMMTPREEPMPRPPAAWRMPRMGSLARGGQPVEVHIIHHVHPAPILRRVA